MESGSYTKLGRFVAKPMSFCPCGGCQSISSYCQSLTDSKSFYFARIEPSKQRTLEDG